MCGIVGYLGSRNSLPIILNGLKRLEYRGYDSSGVAIFNGSNIETCKSKGKISKLEKQLKKKKKSEWFFGNWSYQMGNTW